MKITAQELRNLMRARTGKPVQIIDVRTLSEYMNCRIKQAFLVPLQHLDDLQVTLKNDRNVYVISFNGRRAEEFSRKLNALGYRSFYVEGGLAAWYKSGFPVEQLSEQSCFDKNLHPVFNVQIRPGVNTSLKLYFDTIIGAVYFFEKLGANVKFIYSKEFSFFERSAMYFFEKLGIDVRSLCGKEFSFLEKSVVIVSEEHRSEEFVDFPCSVAKLDVFQRYARSTSPDYAHQVMSRLSFDQNLRKQADEWCAENLKGDWVGVHHRSTDTYWREEHVEIDTYIAYLKEHVGKHCDIFACSDQVQFIDRIHKAFPGRVFSRDIPRSYDQRPLHLDPAHKGHKQSEDALIDILILAKAARIYKTGGAFTLLARYFNPSVKIIYHPQSKVGL